MSAVTYDRVQGQFARLKLAQLPDRLDGLAEEATKQGWTYVDFLDRLLAAEIEARSARDIAMKTKLAHFPAAKTLEDFDFAFQPSINERDPRVGDAARDGRDDSGRTRIERRRARDWDTQPPGPGLGWIWPDGSGQKARAPERSQYTGRREVWRSRDVPHSSHGEHTLRNVGCRQCRGMVNVRATARTRARL